jgi:hypothetical protein
LEKLRWEKKMSVDMSRGADVSHILSLNFTEPPRGWTIDRCASFLQDVDMFSQVLNIIENRLPPEEIFDRVSLSTGDFYQRYQFSRGENSVLVLSKGESLYRFHTGFSSEILSFSFNSPIKTMISTAFDISKASIDKLLDIYKHVVHHEATNRRLHAEADIVEQKALKEKLENIKNVCDLHDSIKDDGLRDRVAEVLHDSIMPLARKNSPKLQSIKLLDDKGQSIE